MTWQRSVASLLAVLAAVVGGLFWFADAQADRRQATAEDAFPPEGDFVEVDGRRVHYVRRGEGPDVILIHGASGNLRDMTFDLMGRLQDRYRVTAFDRPGLGYTDAAPDGHAEGPAEQAALLRDAAAALGTRQPIVLGHSFGGAVALAWALDDREGVAAVVDVSGVAMPWPGPLNRLYRLNGTRLGGKALPVLVAGLAPGSTVEAALASTFRPQDVPPGYAEHFGLALSIRRESFRANARQVNSLRPEVEAMSARYGTLDMPVEVIFGEEDTIVPPSVHALPFVWLVNSAELRMLPGVGHMPHHADPQAVVDAVDRALSRARANPRPGIPVP